MQKVEFTLNKIFIVTFSIYYSYVYNEEIMRIPHYTTTHQTTLFYHYNHTIFFSTINLFYATLSNITIAKDTKNITVGN